MEKLICLAFRMSMLFFICLGSSCSEEEEGRTTNTILEVIDQTIDFEEKANTQTIAIDTNQDDWTATVDQNGRNWCSIVPSIGKENHSLAITVTQNTSKEQRATTITIKAAELSKQITVRQLGTDKGILISPQVMTVKAEGAKIEFKITANVEFDITTDEWITLPIATRSGDYVTTDYIYMVQRNKGLERTGAIIVKDKESDYSNKLIVVQKAFGEYEGGESTIQGDILVPVAKGNAINASGNVSQLASSGFQRAYDGSKETGYHSNTVDDFPKNWPLKFTFEFEQQPRLDYCIYYPSGSEIIKKAEIFVSTVAEPEYKKLMDVNLPGSSSAVRISFPKPIIHPKGIRIEATETSGRYVIIKEMEFYRQNPENFDPLTLFTDLSCTELKQGITENEIDACPDPLFRNIAYYMSINQYPRDFRIQEYEAYPHPRLFQQQNKTSHQHDLLENPTGIFVTKKSEVILLIGDTYGQQLSARVLNLNVPGEDGFNQNYSYPLSAGVNRFVPETDGLIYIYYHTPDYKSASPIKIHIPSGQVNGYFDSQIHQASDWNRLLNAAVAPHFDVLGTKAHLIFPVDKFKANTPDGKLLIDAYDRLVLLEQQFMGLEKYNRMEPNNRVCFSVMYNKSYMYASSNHTGYVISTMNELCDLNKLCSSSIWGPAHEVGHTYQTKGLCWHGMTEVTNNIHSLYVQTSFDNQSRLLDKQGSYTSIYEKSMSVFFTQKRAHIINDSDVNVFNQLVPFWQLYLYTKAIGNEDYYKDLYELMRIRPDKATPGESQVEFTVSASEVAGLDLTVFFEKWGFFEPVDIEIDDYGKKRFIVTKEMADNAKQRIADLRLPKPSGIIEYICDNTINCYTSNHNIQKGTAQKEGQKFTMNGWQNVVAYEVYSDGKLCFISPASSFTVVGNLGASVQLFAVSASNEKVEVTFN